MRWWEIALIAWVVFSFPIGFIVGLTFKRWDQEALATFQRPSSQVIGEQGKLMVGKITREVHLWDEHCEEMECEEYSGWGSMT